MARFDEQWTQISERCITVMLGLFATICIFTILHSSEQFVTARNMGIFTVNWIIGTCKNAEGKESQIVQENKWEVQPRMYGWTVLGDWWLLMIFAAPCWRLMREYERCELCGPWRRGGPHLYAIDGALSSVLTSSLVECQRPTYNQVWSQAQLVTRELSVYNPSPHH